MNETLRACAWADSGVKYRITKLTITTHPDSDALLESAILAAVPVDPQDAALLILRARSVLDLLLNAAPEESLRITNETLVSLTVTVRGGSRRAIGPLARGGQVTFAQAPHEFTRVNDICLFASSTTLLPLSSNYPSLSRSFPRSTKLAGRSANAKLYYLPGTKLANSIH